MRFEQGDRFSLPIELAAGEVLALTADRPPGLVELQLYAPDSEPCQPREDLPPDPAALPLAVGELRGDAGRQRLETVAEWNGTYRLVVRAKNPASRDTVTLTLTPRRPATSDDELRAQAARAFRTGELWSLNVDEKRAGPEFRHALALARAAGDRRLEGWATLGLGWAEPTWQDAVPHFEAALARFQEIGDGAGVVETHKFLGIAAQNLADPERSDAQFAAALAAAEALADPGLELEVRYRWSRAVGARAQRIDDACEQLAELARRAAELGDPNLRYRIDFWRGAFERSRYRLDAAIERLSAALEFAPTLYERARTVNVLGMVYDDLGEYQQARESMIQAVDTFERIHLGESRVGELSSSLANLGDISQRLGDLPAMTTSYQRAKSHLPKDAEQERVRVLRALAWAAAHAGRHQEALEAADQAIRLSHDPAENAISRGMFGEVLLAQAGDDPMGVAQARTFLVAALADYSALSNRRPVALARLYEFVGEANRRLRGYDEARTALESALAVHEKIGSLIDIAFDHYYLARVERERGQLALAQEHVERALETYQRLRERVGHAEARASFGSARPREVQEFYVDLLMERHLLEPTAGFDRLALSASERARGQSLLDLVAQGPSTARNVPRALLDEREAVRRALRGLDLERRAFASTPPSAEAHARWQNELFSRESELQRIDEQIRRLAPSYDALVRAEPATVEAIQALLDPDTVLLEYLLGDERSYLWVVTPSSVSAYTLSARRELERPALELHRTLTRWSQPPVEGSLTDFRKGLERDASALLGSLGGSLLGPSGAILGTKRLVIVADGALEYVPFPSLLNPATGRRLVEDHVVARLPSASVLAAQRRFRSPEKDPAGRRLAVFADPVYDSLPALPFTRREAESLRELAPGETVVALGAGASRERVLTSDLAAFRYLHFAVHGKIDAEFPSFSKLVLAERDEGGQPVDGELTLTDIYGLSLAADLVVLSACDTALGKNVRGEGLLGLTRGFLYAGAGAVLSTLWQVQDGATTKLMERFYRALLVEGQAPADALAAAQRETRSEPGREFPYYWAGFVLQGEWR